MIPKPCIFFHILHTYLWTFSRKSILYVSYNHWRLWNCLHYASCQTTLGPCIFFHIFHTCLWAFSINSILFVSCNHCRPWNYLHYTSYQIIPKICIFFHIMHTFLWAFFRKPNSCVPYNHCTWNYYDVQLQTILYDMKWFFPIDIGIDEGKYFIPYIVGDSQDSLH